MYACKTIIMRQVVLCYEIGFREGVHTLRGSTILGFRGSGSGLRVRIWVATGSFSDSGKDWFGVGGASDSSGSVPFLSPSRSSGHVDDPGVLKKYSAFRRR